MAEKHGDGAEAEEGTVGSRLADAERLILEHSTGYDPVLHAPDVLLQMVEDNIVNENDDAAFNAALLDVAAARGANPSGYAALRAALDTPPVRHLAGATLGPPMTGSASGVRAPSHLATTSRSAAVGALGRAADAASRRALRREGREDAEARAFARRCIEAGCWAGDDLAERAGAGAAADRVAERAEVLLAAMLYRDGAARLLRGMLGDGTRSGRPGGRGTGRRRVGGGVRGSARHKRAVHAVPRRSGAGGAGGRAAANGGVV